MGVKLKDIIESEKITLKDLEGRAIAIDAFNTLYQFLSIIRQRDGTPLMDENGNITSHLSGILYRNANIVEKGIKPIYIFDGSAPKLKKDTVAERREIREKSEEKWKEELEKGNITEARKYAMRSTKLSGDIIESSKKLLTLMGIPYVEAPGEGEAQAAYMVQKGDAWAVASQDYDCLLFGAKRVVRNLAISSNLGSLEMYTLKKVLNNLGVSREELVDMGLLIGTDFDKGLKGVGAKTALKLAKKNELENALEKLQKEKNELEELRRIFLSPSTTSNYEIKWGKSNKEGIIQFLCDNHGFSQERVLNSVDKLKNLNSSQKSLEDWF